jgi:hypothetical protein
MKWVKGICLLVRFCNIVIKTDVGTKAEDDTIIRICFGRMRRQRIFFTFFFLRSLYCTDVKATLWDYCIL